MSMVDRHRKFLLYLSKNIKKTELEEIVFLMGNKLAQKLSRVKKPYKLFEILLNKRIISADKLDFLHQHLSEIGRSDLAEKINGYKESTTPAPQTASSSTPAGNQPIASTSTLVGSQPSASSSTPAGSPAASCSSPAVDPLPEREQIDLLYSGFQVEEDMHVAIEQTLQDDNEQETAQLNATLSASLIEAQKTPDENVLTNDQARLQEVLRDFVSSISSKGDDQEERIIVLRSKLLKTALRAVRNPHYNFYNKVKVEFSGEQGVDYGGPTREFFHLLMVEISNSDIFTGVSSRNRFLLDVGKLANQRYFNIGQLVGWSITHNGPGISFLLPGLYNLMVGLPPGRISSKDIPHTPSGEMMAKIENCQNEEDYLRTRNEIEEEVMDYWVGIVTCQFENRETLLNVIWSYAVYHRCKSAINQFIHGVNSVGNLWQLVVENPKCFRALFTAENQAKLTWAVAKNLFVPMYSEQGTNNRTQESETTYCWDVFLQACEKRETRVSLEDLLVFVTGADKIPTLGFPKIVRIEFFDREPPLKRLPWTSTCDLSLHLPRNCEDPDEFIVMMEKALLESPGFGFA